VGAGAARGGVGHLVFWRLVGVWGEMEGRWEMKGEGGTCFQMSGWEVEVGFGRGIVVVVVGGELFRIWGVRRDFALGCGSGFG